MAQRVSPGQPFSLPPSSLWNGMVSAGEAYRDAAELGMQGADVPRQIDFSRVVVRNDSGADIAAGRVLEVGAKLLTTMNRNNRWFEGETPAADGTRLWGVVDREIKDGKLGELIICGAVLARVSVGHASHTHADVTASSTTLTSGFHGARILWKTSGTGTSDCIIALGPTERGPYKAKADSTISAGSSGTVSIWLDGTDSGANETAYLSWIDNGGSIASGSELYISWFPADGKWRITNAEC